MRNFLLRVLAAILAVVCLFYGAGRIDSPDSTPVSAWAWLVVGTLLAFHALTGRPELPGRRPGR